MTKISNLEALSSYIILPDASQTEEGRNRINIADTLEKSNSFDEFIMNGDLQGWDEEKKDKVFSEIKKFITEYRNSFVDQTTFATGQFI